MATPFLHASVQHLGLGHLYAGPKMQGTNAICTQLVTLDPQIAVAREWVLIGSSWRRR